MSQQYDPCEVEMEFADGVYLFRLPRKRIAELQIKCGSGIGAIFKRVCATFDYYESDLFETVRLGLIGGGADPQEAKRLIEHYCDEWPLDVWHRHALSILAACVKGYSASDGEADEKKP